MWKIGAGAPEGGGARCGSPLPRSTIEGRTPGRPRRPKTATMVEPSYRRGSKPIVSLVAISCQGKRRPQKEAGTISSSPWLYSSNKSALRSEGDRSSAHLDPSSIASTHRIPHNHTCLQGLRFLCKGTPGHLNHFVVSLESDPLRSQRRASYVPFGDCFRSIGQSPLLFSLQAIPRSPISPTPTTPPTTIGPSPSLLAIH